jgi:hypothetical protein
MGLAEVLTAKDELIVERSWSAAVDVDHSLQYAFKCHLRFEAHELFDL